MKSLPIDKVLIALSTLLLIGGVTLSYMAFNKINPIVISDKSEKNKFFKQEDDNLKVDFFSLPKIQTNIENGSSRLMQAEMTVVLEPENGIKVDTIKSYESFISDLVITIVSQSNIEDLNNISGKIILAEKIKNGTNEIMHQKAVKRVLFSTFSVQIQ